MNVKKTFFVKLPVFILTILTLSFIGPAFSQNNQLKRRVSSGVIEWISRDFKYIAINKIEHHIVITPQTKVLDEKGNILKVSDLRRGLNIVVEIVRNPGGPIEKRIIIKK